MLVNWAPHQLDLLLWYMGEVDEVYGVWKNLNHPYIEVEDTAVAVVKFKSGAVGNIVVVTARTQRRCIRQGAFSVRTVRPQVCRPMAARCSSRA